ncbi:hypothetical protein ONE63_001025 [Megalurothrips usitatus]|uniref:Uncharacterized protein n=1 Tax=Megalurothrips usitatus TaxID=439358 RepID=A0AAV7XEL3_9NEOP|nr:hypothetical protein ONE63_001025 [Megalurothrips usitatus]
MRHVLKRFLELPNVFSSIQDYLEKLGQNPGKLSNVVQGTLLDAFEYGPSDICNRIPVLHCKVSALQDCSRNLSASEYLCLARYLCLMVGDLIPEGNQVWKLHLILREIVEILTSPVIDCNIKLYIQTLVEEHHKLYINCFGHLKPKHHFLIHHPALLEGIGPVVHLSTLASERNHRRGKKYARVSNSRVNTAKPVAVKFQLMLSKRLSRPDNFGVRVETFKVQNVRLHLLPNYLAIAESVPLNADEVVCTCKKVEVSGTMYCLKMVIVISIGDLMPSFGRITNIFIVNDDVYLVVKKFETVGFVNHYFSYEIRETEVFVCLRQQDMISHVPLWAREVNGFEVVCLKHGL